MKRWVEKDTVEKDKKSLRLFFRLDNTWHSMSPSHTSPASTTAKQSVFADGFQRSLLVVKPILSLFTTQVSAHPPVPWLR